MGTDTNVPDTQCTYFGLLHFWGFWCPDQIVYQFLGRMAKRLIFTQEKESIMNAHQTTDKEQTHKHTSHKETDFPSSLDLQSIFVYGPAHSHNANWQQKDAVPRLKWSHRQPRELQGDNSRAGKLDPDALFTATAAFPAPTSVIIHVQLICEASSSRKIYEAYT